jgi:hypothetical protein
MICKQDICRLLNAAWHDYNAGKLKMLQMPAEIEAVKNAVTHLKHGDKDLAESECKKFAGSHTLWRLAIQPQYG